MITGSILSLVTLFLNNNILNNFEGYTPISAKSAYQYYYNEPNHEARPVDYDSIFENSTVFPKCCQPDFQYDADNKECVKVNDMLPVYHELNISVNLIKYGLSECIVVIDRFVSKNNVTRFDGNGTLVIDQKMYPDGKFCIDKIVQDNNSYVIRLCKDREYCLSDDKVKNRDWCVYKCCPDTYALQDNICAQTSKPGLRVKKNRDFYERVDGYGFYYGDNLTCAVANWIDFQELNFSIRTNGSLFKSGEDREYKIDEYCLGTRYNTKTKSYTDTLIVCEFSKVLYAKWTILRVIVTLSCICFAITIAVYIFVYRMQKIAEKLITCFCFVDLIFWMMYALRIFYVPFEEFCTTFGYIYFFIMISRLSWLNVLSYEIWRTIGKVRSKVGETKETQRKKFLYYSAYAITIPTVCTVFFIMSDQEVYPLPEIIKPYINPAGCAIDITRKGNYGHYIHLYVPIWILIIINIVFYARTLQHFLKVKSDLNKISGTASNQQKREMKNNKKKGFIILKLGLIMGLTWIYHIYDYINSFENIEVLRTIGDILRFSNILEGLYFLIIFVIKWKKIKEFLSKWNPSKKEQFLSPTISTASTISVTVSASESIDGVPMETLQK